MHFPTLNCCFVCVRPAEVEADSRNAISHTTTRLRCWCSRQSRFKILSSSRRDTVPACTSGTVRARTGLRTTVTGWLCSATAGICHSTVCHSAVRDGSTCPTAATAAAGGCGQLITTTADHSRSACRLVCRTHRLLMFCLVVLQSTLWTHCLHTSR